MHYRIAGRWLIVLMALAGTGCSDSTGSDGGGNCALTTVAFSLTPADLSARVSTVTFDNEIGPWGPLNQYNLWLTIAPSIAPNAGLVVGKAVPVFVQVGSTPVMASSACAIAVGDSLHVWHDATVVYGAVEAPPGAPAYYGTQVLIVRPQAP